MAGTPRAASPPSRLFLWLRRATGWLFLSPALLLVGLLAIGLGYIVEASFHELDIATYRLREAYSLGNYIDISTRPVYWRILGRSVAGALLVTAISLCLAFPYAYLLTRIGSAAWRKFLLVALFLPFFIGQVVRAYGWLIILGKKGIVNALLAGIGLPALDLIYHYGAVIFGLVQYMLPFAVLLILPAMAAIPEDVERASEGLGATWPRTLLRVVLPMARPGLIGAGIVVFTLTLTDYAMPEILGGGSNDFIASAIYDSFFQISNAGLGAALSVALVLVGSVFVAVFFSLARGTTLDLGGQER